MIYIHDKNMIRQTVEIFKTDVHDLNDATKILAELNEIYPALRINFDLEDCDRILRVEGFDPDLKSIQKCLNSFGFSCEVIA